jgi:signal transduction histidine kinase
MNAPLLASLIELGASLLCFAVAWHAWGYRDRPAGTPLFMLALTTAAWALAASTASLVADPGATRTAQFASLALSGPAAVAWFYVVVAYTRRSWWTRPVVVAAVLGLVAVEWATLATNPLHQQYVTTASQITAAGAFDPVPGPLHWMHTVWKGGLLTVGLGALLRAYTSRQGVLRLQSVALIVTGVLPLGTGVLELLDVFTLPSLDLTVVGIAAGSAIVLWALFSAAFLDVVPIARETLLESMNDAVVALDAAGRVVDLNRQATVLFDVGSTAIGAPATTVLDEHPQIFADPLLAGFADRQRAHDQRTGDQPTAGDQRTSDRPTAGDQRTGGCEELTDDERPARYSPVELTATVAGDQRHYELDVTPVTASKPAPTDTRQPPSEARTANGGLPADGGMQATEASDADPLGLLLVFRDVTVRQRREREVEARNTRLEEFSSVVSHDLRNPLNVAQGRLELARETADTENLATAARALDRMDALVEDLLTLAREGRSVSETEPVSLPAVVRQCWGTVVTDAARLVVESERTIRADRSRLRELLENLLRNAVSHAGPDVTVTVGDLADGSGFYVADDGPGIPESERERAFESGYTTADDGTGLGLAIVREIAQAHGWTVSLTESEAGGMRIEFRGVEIES